MADTRMLDRGELDASTDPDLKPPSFSCIEEERAHRKARLAGACRIFARHGYDHWVAGHLTVRDPEHADRFWVNPLGVSWHRIRVSDLLQVDFSGRVIQGTRPVNAAAFAIHSEIHRGREDVVAAAHAHTPYGRAWSATGRPLEPISQDHCAFYQEHAVFDDFTGAVYDSAESRRFSRALKGQYSPWHRELEPAKPFTTEAAARAFVEATGAPHPIQVDDVLASFLWDIHETEIEHRENWSMGTGYYLGESKNSGWIEACPLSYRHIDVDEMAPYLIPNN